MMFFKVEQKETRYLGYMSNKICHQEFSKIALSDPTAQKQKQKGYTLYSILELIFPYERIEFPFLKKHIN